MQAQAAERSSRDDFSCSSKQHPIIPVRSCLEHRKRNHLLDSNNITCSTATRTRVCQQREIATYTSRFGSHERIVM